MSNVEFGDPRLPDNFWSKVAITTRPPKIRPDLGPCWYWTATLNKDGYGRIRFRKLDNWCPLAHRAIWELTQGPITYPDELDHLCRVRHCVNVRHLEVVPHAENVRRGNGGKYWANRASCSKGHPYDELNTKYGPSGSRVCIKCQRENGAKWRERNPEKSRANVKKWAENNKERVQQYQKEHREEANIRRALWRAKRREQGLPPS